MEKCNWLNIWELIEFHSLIMLWKVTQLKIPLQIYKRLEIDEETSLIKTKSHAMLFAKTLVCLSIPLRLSIVASYLTFRFL